MVSVQIPMMTDRYWSLKTLVLNDSAIADTEAEPPSDPEPTAETVTDTANQTISRTETPDEIGLQSDPISNSSELSDSTAPVRDLTPVEQMADERVDDRQLTDAPEIYQRPADDPQDTNSQSPSMLPSSIAEQFDNLPREPQIIERSLPFPVAGDNSNRKSSFSMTLEPVDEGDRKPVSDDSRRQPPRRFHDNATTMSADDF